MRLSRIDCLLRRQEGMETIDRESIEAMQLRKLNALLAREKKRAGFYGSLPAELRSLRELAELPFTTEAELASRGGAMLLRSAAEAERVLSDVTSGTTGEGKRLFYTRGDLENTVALFVAGLGELVLHGNRVMICMPFSGPNGLGELICLAIQALGAEPLRLGSGRSYGELREALETMRPECYVGMPTELLSLLRVCGRGSLRRALVSGDACPATVTEECQAMLGSRLFPHYGSREMALGGAICCQAHQGMHLRENHVIAEIVDADGSPLPPGETGELVISTIGMEAQPLIRYRTGDFTRLLPGVCPCGSQVARLDAVTRMGAAGEMAELDGALFALPRLVDYRARRIDGGLSISALSLGRLDPEALRELCPRAREICVRPVTDEDRAMYRGKRRIE